MPSPFASEVLVENFVHTLREDDDNMFDTLATGLSNKTKFVPNDSWNPGSGVWANLLGDTTKSHLFVAQLAHTVDHYGDSKNVPNTSMDTNRVEKIRLKMTFACPYDIEDKLSQEVNNDIKQQYVNLFELEENHRDMLTAKKIDLSSVQINRCISATTETDFTVTAITDPLWNRIKVDQNQALKNIRKATTSTMQSDEHSLLHWDDDLKKFSHLEPAEKRQFVQNRSIAIRDMLGKHVFPEHYDKVLVAGEWVVISGDIRSWYIPKPRDGKQPSLTYHFHINEATVITRALEDYVDSQQSASKKRSAPDDFDQNKRKLLPPKSKAIQQLSDAVLNTLSQHNYTAPTLPSAPIPMNVDKSKQPSTSSINKNKK